MKCSAPVGKDCSQVFRSHKLTEFCTRLSRVEFSNADSVLSIIPNYGNTDLMAEIGHYFAWYAKDHQIGTLDRL